MIDQLITLFGISHNYTFFAMILAGCITILFMFEFLFLISSIFKKIGGFR